MTEDLQACANRLAEAVAAGQWRPSRADKALIGAIRRTPLVMVPASKGSEVGPVVISATAVRRALMTTGPDVAARTTPGFVALLTAAAAVQDMPSLASTPDGQAGLVAVTRLVYRMRL